MFRLQVNLLWDNRRLIRGCLYSLVLARGPFLKRFPTPSLECARFITSHYQMGADQSGGSVCRLSLQCSHHCFVQIEYYLQIPLPLGAMLHSWHRISHYYVTQALVMHCFAVFGVLPFIQVFNELVAAALLLLCSWQRQKPFMVYIVSWYDYGTIKWYY